VIVDDLALYKWPAAMSAKFRKYFEALSRIAATAIGAALALAVIVAAPPAAAQEAAASPWVRNEHAALRLIAAATAAGSADTVQVGLQFELRPGWKTYWRNPGDAGFPPHGDWSRSTNVADVRVAWPAPERFELLGFETFGYERQVVLPMTVRVAHPGQAVALRGSVDYLVCERICVPYTAELDLQLPAGTAGPSNFAHLINRYVSQAPSAGVGLTVEAATLRLDPPALAVRVASALPIARPDAIVEGAAGWSFTRPRVELASDRLSATLVLPAQGNGADARALVGQPLTITAIDDGRAVEAQLSVAAPTGDEGATLLGILGLALLGGLILNLMPCVLPVLSLKLLAVVGQAGAACARARVGFLASAAGIFAAFAVLAGGLIALRAAGHTIGWGIQFQQPLFLTFMALVVTLFAANLWGWFELGLPGSVADRLDRAAAAAERRGSLAGSFVTGAFATLLATPCSAPFLGTAVGFALARGPREIAAIFAALALGLALPYLALAAMPGIAARLPRPGPWMDRLRVVLGLAMAGTAMWLLVILRAQIGDAMTAAVATVLAALLAALFALRHARRMMRAAAIALAAGLAFVPLGIGGAAPVARGVATGPWHAFERERIGALVREGKVVFVDVTADWCLICQVNKAAVIGRGAVAARLAAPEVVAMRADWTRPDPRVSAYLASFGRYGIPFNAVYGPGAPDGIALPEILTEDAVLQALARAQAAR
jgi:suppressor for copper-sensitivity B